MFNEVKQGCSVFHRFPQGQEDSCWFFQVLQGSVRSDTGFHNVQEDPFRFNEVLPGSTGSPWFARHHRGSPRFAETR